MESGYNKPVYIELLGRANDFPYPSYSIKYMKKNLDVTKPRYCEHMSPVPGYTTNQKFAILQHIIKGKVVLKSPRSLSVYVLMFIINSLYFAEGFLSS